MERKTNTVVSTLVLVLIIFLALTVVFSSFLYERKSAIANNLARGSCDIMLVADVSSSMSRRELDGKLKLDWAKDAMVGLMNSLIPYNSVNSIFIGLSYFEGAASRSGLPQGLTSTLSSLINPIQALSFQGGPGTCIECGLKLANNEIFANSTQASKHVILLSDGCGNRVPSGAPTTTESAKANAVALADEGRAQGVTYYTVGYGNDNAPQDINGCKYDNDTLVAIAGSGANFSYKPNVQDWAQTFIDIANRACPVIIPTPTVTPTATPTFTPTPTPTPTTTPTITPTATPTVTPTPAGETKLKICKYEDDNDNGEKNDGEDVMSWKFFYRVKDEDRHEVESHWWNFLNQGCAIVTVPAGKEITVEEESRSGWRLTKLYADGEKKDGSSHTYTSEVDRIKVIWFLNTYTPGSSPVSYCSSLSASTTAGTAPLTVNFSGSGFDSSGNIQEYEFNFGDASGGQPQTWNQTGTTASHRYEIAGNYTATLKVKDSRGNWQGGNDGCRVYLTVFGQPQVLGTSTPPVLPKSGASVAGSLGLFSLLGSLGVFLVRRFKLL